MFERNNIGYNKIRKDVRVIIMKYINTNLISVSNNRYMNILRPCDAKSMKSENPPNTLAPLTLGRIIRFCLI